MRMLTANRKYPRQQQISPSTLRFQMRKVPEVLQDPSKLSIPLLKSIAALLTLLGEAFNADLASKLLSDVQRWCDPDVLRDMLKEAGGNEVADAFNAAVKLGEEPQTVKPIGRPGSAGQEQSTVVIHPSVFRPPQALGARLPAQPLPPFLVQVTNLLRPQPRVATGIINVLPYLNHVESHVVPATIDAVVRLEAALPVSQAFGALSSPFRDPLASLLSSYSKLSTRHFLCASSLLDDRVFTLLQYTIRSREGRTLFYHMRSEEGSRLIASACFYPDEGQPALRAAIRADYEKVHRRMSDQEAKRRGSRSSTKSTDSLDGEKPRASSDDKSSAGEAALPDKAESEVGSTAADDKAEASSEKK